MVKRNLKPFTVLKSQSPVRLIYDILNTPMALAPQPITDQKRRIVMNWAMLHVMISSVSWLMTDAIGDELTVPPPLKLFVYACQERGEDMDFSELISDVWLYLNLIVILMSYFYLIYTRNNEKLSRCQTIISSLSVRCLCRNFSKFTWVSSWHFWEVRE